MFEMKEMCDVLYCRMTLLYFDVAYKETEEFWNHTDRRMNRDVKNDPKKGERCWPNTSLYSLALQGVQVDQGNLSVPKEEAHTGDTGGEFKQWEEERQHTNPDAALCRKTHTQTHTLPQQQSWQTEFSTKWNTHVNNDGEADAMCRESIRTSNFMFMHNAAQRSPSQDRGVLGI